MRIWTNYGCQKRCSKSVDKSQLSTVVFPQWLWEHFCLKFWLCFAGYWGPLLLNKALPWTSRAHALPRENNKDASGSAANRWGYDSGILHLRWSWSSTIGYCRPVWIPCLLMSNNSHFTELQFENCRDVWVWRITTKMNGPSQWSIADSSIGHWCVPQPT